MLSVLAGLLAAQMDSFWILCGCWGSETRKAATSCDDKTRRTELQIKRESQETYGGGEGQAGSRDRSREGNTRERDRETPGII